MLNFADWVINTDWGTPLLVLTVALLIGLCLLAAFFQWLDALCELAQDEAERDTGFKTEAAATEHGLWHWGWRTHHI